MCRQRVNRFFNVWAFLKSLAGSTDVIRMFDLSLVVDGGERRFLRKTRRYTFVLFLTVCSHFNWVTEHVVLSVQVGDIEFNRIPENYFQDVEQVAFSPANIVPGMGYSPDRLLQVRSICVPFQPRIIRGKNNWKSKCNVRLLRSERSDGLISSRAKLWHYWKLLKMWLTRFVCLFHLWRW